MTDDARPPRSDVRGRALLAFAAVALVAAGVFLRMGLDGGDTPEATLEITPVVVSTIPVTIPPIAAAAARVPVVTEAPTGTQAPLSPLAAQLGPRGSAIPTLASERVLPATVTIDDIELWGPVRSVGLKETGELEIPDETEIGWYELGAAPGEAGATVLAAHVTWNDTVGPFYRLGDLDPGAKIRIRLSDDSIRLYEVVERTMYRKDALPNWRIFRQTGPESLVLITCGGSFNPSIRRYRENIVVYAVPVGAEPAPAG
jgi:Sortase domain